MHCFGSHSKCSAYTEWLENKTGVTNSVLRKTTSALLHLQARWLFLCLRDTGGNETNKSIGLHERLQWQALMRTNVSCRWLRNIECVRNNTCDPKDNYSVNPLVIPGAFCRVKSQRATCPQRARDWNILKLPLYTVWSVHRLLIGAWRAQCVLIIMTQKHSLCT